MPVFTIGTPDGRKLKIKAPDQATAVRGAKEYVAANPKGQAAAELNANASRLSQQLKGGPGPKPAPAYNFADNVTASIENTVNGLPFGIGPAAQNVSDAILGVGSKLTGGDFNETVRAQQEARKRRAAQYPLATTAGNLAGGLAGFGGVGLVKGGAEALGMTGPILQRMANSGLSSAGSSILDSMAHGDDAAQQLESGAIGGGIGALIPGLGAGIKSAGRAVFKPAAETVRGIVNPTKEAAKAVGTAMARDRGNAAAPLISAKDAAAARMNGQQLLNVDRGGETTRALMRSASNQNPEARAVVDKTAEDRFRSQAPRATDFLRRLMGGNVDDLARKAQIDADAAAVNKPAYRAAYNAPKARAVWSPGIRQLMQSDMFRQAINGAESVGTDFAGLSGVKAVRNPFVFGQDGAVSLKKMADGSTALPSLQFWDIVQRNLRKVADTARRAGDDETASRAGQMRTMLNKELDTAVPEFNQARRGAAEFFGAEDAVDAGRKAFSAPKAIDESLAAFNSMTGAEKKDFGLGMVSQAMDDIRAGNNRSNLTRMFDSEARKALMRAALGEAKYGQFEAFVRVEDIMDKVRGAMGNSTTARQLAEMGLVNELKNTGGSGAIGGLGAFAATGGNLSTAMTVAMLTAAGRAGFRAVQGKANAQVLQKVAELLASGSEADLNKVIANAMISKQHMLALEAIQKGIGTTARATTQMAIAAQ